MFSRISAKSLRVAPLVLLMAVSVPVASAAQQGIRVYDKGFADGARFYEVICKDGKRAAVRHMFDVPEREGKPPVRSGSGRISGSNANKMKSVEICADTVGGNTSCQTKWTVDKAATFACKDR